MSWPIRLADFEVHPVTGFLPSPDPLMRLPRSFVEWDWLGAQLPALLLAGKARSYIADMPLLEVTHLQGKAQLERAMLLLSTFANAYVWGEPQSATRLPRNLAVPLWKVAEMVGRKPIIGYTSQALNNWRRINPHEGIELENLALVQPFLNSSDEAWFTLVAVEVEARGAASLPHLLGAQQAVATHDTPTLKEALRIIASSIEQMIHSLARLYEKCDPHIFYHRVRPFLAAWNAPGVIYEGVSETPVVYAGGTAAQSALLQALDAALGIRHASEVSGPFFYEMRQYMPPAHRRFIEALERGPQVWDYVRAHREMDPSLAEYYTRCIDLLATFRQQHMEIAVRYIRMQAPKHQGTKGTGGTDFTTFLGTARRETREHRLL